MTLLSASYFLKYLSAVVREEVRFRFSWAGEFSGGGSATVMARGCRGSPPDPAGQQGRWRGGPPTAARVGHQVSDSRR
jgi:hypothetical protein